MSLQLYMQVLPEELVLTIISFLYSEMDNLHFSKYVPPYDDVWPPCFDIAFKQKITNMKTPIFNGAYMLSRLYKNTNDVKYYVTKCIIQHTWKCGGKSKMRTYSEFAGNELSKAFIALKLAYDK